MSCTKPIQLQLIIVYLVTFSLANSVSNALVSISTGAAALYIICDYVKKVHEGLMLLYIYGNVFYVF